MKFYYYILVLVLLFSCKEDHEIPITGEDEYFEDYEEPLNKWGFINKKGNIVIDKVYDDLRPFKNGLARANFAGKWGFIDIKGNAVIPFEYRGTFPFKDGLARIQNFDKKYGFIDRTGKLIIPDTMGLVFDFDSGRARAEQNGEYGYIDTQGKWVIEPAFKKCSNFENEHARVYQFEKAALIDKQGAFKIRYEEGNQKMFSTKVDLVRAKKDGVYRFYDLNSYKVVKDGLINATDFEDGLSAVEISEGKWSVVNMKFKEQFTIDAEKLKYGGNGNWICKTSDGYHVINADGKRITGKDYSMIFAYNDGFAPFEENGYWGYLDVTGDEAMKATLLLAWEFQENYARVISKGKISYIDTTFALAVPDGYQDAHNFSEGLAHVQ